MAGEKRFRTIALDRDESVSLSALSALTRRDEQELIYLLFSPAADKSRSFGIFDGERLVGFQAFVYKPLAACGRLVHSFRSEFTIAEPELRGTGLFPHFYRWTMSELRREFDPSSTYIWGETAHRGWLKYGFRMWKRYSFYQVRSEDGARYPELARLMGSPYRIASAVSRRIAPRIRPSPKSACTTELSHAAYRNYVERAYPTRWRLQYDAEAFRQRFALNPFYSYEFWHTSRALVVVRVGGGWAMISDVLASSASAYGEVLGNIVDAHPRCALHGNIMSEGRAPYFWLNCVYGFIPFVGGGAFVEDNRTCPAVTLANIPLYEAYDFGVPAVRPTRPS